MPKPKGMEREVYLAVCVDFNAQGDVTGAKVDCEGAPWTYCAPETWTPETEEWASAEDDDADAAEVFVSEALADAGRAAALLAALVRLLAADEAMAESPGIGTRIEMGDARQNAREAIARARGERGAS